MLYTMEAYLTSTRATRTIPVHGFHRVERGTGSHMSKKDRKTAPEQPVVTTETPKAESRSLHMAREANVNPAVDKAAPVRATLVRPSKGENKERRRVFGYDNGPGGKVPLGAKCVVVNADGLKASYPGLAEALAATPEADVKTLKSAGVASKSFRRAFRSGLIRFSAD